MKPLNIKYNIRLLLIVLSVSYTTFVCAGPPIDNSSVKGAASLQELSEVLFQALKENNFETLNSFLPDDNQIDLLKSQSDVVENGIYENIDPQLLKTKTHSNFDLIIKNGIDIGINWESLELMNQIEKKHNNLKQLSTVVITLADSREKSLVFSFDAIEISQRWFLFQGIRLEEGQNIIGYQEKYLEEF